MKLAGVGVLTVVIGLITGVIGLIIVGTFWVLGGLAARAIVTRAADRRSVGAREVSEQVGTEATSPDEAADARSLGLLAGTLVFLALGIPSLAIGVIAIGFEPGEESWRWLPIAVGGLILMIGLLSGVSGALGTGLRAASGAPGAAAIPAHLIIESVSETGTRVNDRPRLEFDFTVQPEGGEPYRAKKKATVPHTALGNIRPGDGFEGMVDLERPERVEIDWSRPLSGNSGGVGDPTERLEQLESLKRDGLITGEEYETRRRSILESI